MMRSLLHPLSLFIKRKPGLYFPLTTRRAASRERAVRRETSLVIEGCPRSANTFAVVAFWFAQNPDEGESGWRERERERERESHLAHHLHVPAQVMRAARWNIPALVLIRDPEDVVCSMMVRNPALTPLMAVRYYLSFYRSLIPFRDRFTVGFFEEVTADFGRVIEQVNERFKTSFRPFHHTPENVASVFDRISDVNIAFGTGAESAVARPSHEKEALKLSVRQTLVDPAITPTMKQAADLYQRYRDL